MQDWRTLDETYLMSTYRRLPIAIEKAEGNYLHDTEGKTYLDLFTGLAVSVLGHSHPVLQRALQEQASKFLHISNVFLNQPAILLAKRLVELTFPGKVFFGNSGAEATEAAIKLIHKWSRANDRANAGILVLTNSFHGRTLGALRLTRQASVYQDFPQPDFPVYECEAGNVEALREIMQNHQPAAVVMEPVLGSGGVIPLDQEFLREAAALCKTNGALLCIDEIQTGMGRTGTMFAYQQYGITPDLLLFAKGVGGGLPLGGIIASEKLMNLFSPGDHGTTFAPSPLSAALGNAVLDVLTTEDFLSTVQANATYLWSELTRVQQENPTLISGIRGKGMMLGIVMNLAAEKVSKLQQNLLANGILVDVTQKNIVRLLPPLTLTRVEIDRFITTFTKHISLLFEQNGV